MYEVFLFDFDYTLGDSTRGIEISINYALEQLGYGSRETEEIRKTIGLSLKETYKALTNKDIEEEAKLFAKYFIQKADEVMVKNTQLYEPVKMIFGDLRSRGCKIGIVTTKFRYRIESILDKFNMQNAVDIIVGAEDVKIEKPNPEGLLWAVENLQAEKEKVLYIGDSVVDAETAQRAQIDFAGVLTGTTGREAFQKFPSIGIIENLNQLHEVI